MVNKSPSPLEGERRGERVCLSKTGVNLKYPCISSRLLGNHLDGQFADKLHQLELRGLIACG